jgi:hypothetical protein
MEVYKIASKARLLGEVEAPDEATAMEMVAAEFKVPANRLMAIRRRSPAKAKSPAAISSIAALTGSRAFLRDNEQKTPPNAAAKGNVIFRVWYETTRNLYPKWVKTSASSGSIAPLFNIGEC